MSASSKKVIAIIGAGFSGTLAAIQCCQHEESQSELADYSVLLIEQNSQFALGAAYSTQHLEHLLNVPAWNMSAFSSDKNHFLNWLSENNHHFEKTELVPRKIYGQYIQSLLNEAKAQYAGHLQLIQNKVIAIHGIGKTTPSGAACHPSSGGEFFSYELQCNDGQTIMANQVLLALGNFPPQNPPLKNQTFFHTSGFYWKNPWQPDRETLPKTATCLIIGTGLTMVDKVLELEAAGHTGKIIALSRHGFLPLAHNANSLNPIAEPWTEAELEPVADSPRKLLHWLRAKTRQSPDWRIPILKLRPSIQRIWKHWSELEKKRFLRHGRAWWDVRRHLIDPNVSARLESLQQSGQLTLIAGRLESFEETSNNNLENQVLCKYLDRHTQTNKTLYCDWVINCIGPDGGIGNNPDPLIKQLRDSHQIQADALKLGLKTTDEHYHVLDADGKPQSHLFAIGPLLKGVLWESIAVPELKQQAEQVAESLN